MPGRKPARERLAPAVALCVVWLAAVDPAVAADDKAASPPPAPPPTNEVVLVDAETSEREQKVRSMIMEAFKNSERSADSLGLYSNLVPRDLSFREAVLTALRKNLSIERQGIAKKIADAAIAEASAVFDPVFSVSLAYHHKRSETRIEESDRFKSGTDANNRVTFSEGPIASLQFDAPRPAGFFREMVTANQKPSTGSAQDWTSVFDVAQLLPWGTSLDLNLQINYQPTFFTLNTGASNLEISDSYGRPWVSTLNATIATPLPFSKNFGPLNPNLVAQDLSRLDAQKAFWTTRAVINDTLLQTDQNFWDLVNGARRLYAALETRSLVEDLKRRTDRLFRLRLITEPRKARVDGELERVNSQVDAAFAALAASSNALIQLMGLDEPLFLLPAGYLSLFESPAPIKVDPQLILDNPEYLRAVVDVEAAKLTSAALDVRTRPDVGVSGTVSLKQLNTVFGFRTIEESLQELPNPDQVAMSATASLQWPIGNRAALSALDASHHRLAERRLTERSVRNRLVAAFQAARIQLNSAQERIKITERNQELAQQVYERSLRFQESRRVTEFEIIEKLRGLLAAKNEYIEAQIAAKKAESNLLATTGYLAEYFGARIAQTPFDRRRLKSLNDKGTLRFFGATP